MPSSPWVIWLLILLTLALILSWHFSMVRLYSDAVMVKTAKKLKVQRICLARCSNCLTIGTLPGTLPIGAPEELGEIQILQNLYSFLVICSNLHHLEVEAGGFIYIYICFISVLSNITMYKQNGIHELHNWHIY